MEKCFLHLTYGNKHDGVVSISCMVFKLFFISLFVSWIINCIHLCDSCNYVNIMCKLYAKGQEGTNVKAHYVFGNDSMKMCSNTKQE
jgi:hypothetical protein